MSSLEQVLGVSPGLQAAARADGGGNVVEVAGQMDAESLCAVVALCRGSLDRAAELLELGPLRDWCFTYADSSLFVHHAEAFVVVTGGSSKNPETTMKKIAQALAEKDEKGA